MKEVLAPEKGLVGCMVGRITAENPWIVGGFDREFYGVPNPDLSRKDVILVPSRA